MDALTYLVRRSSWRTLIGLAVLALTLLAASSCTVVSHAGGITPEPSTMQKMEELLQAHRETGDFMGSVLVARGDTVLYSGGYGMANLEHDAPNTQETVFRLGSLTKQFTAAAILQLQERGRVSVKDTIDQYLPDFPHGSEITIHQLLNHTSGIPDYADFSGHSAAFRDHVTLGELIVRFSGRPLDFPPGSQYRYSSSGYAVLTAIIEQASGQHYEEYLAEHIFGPLGMKSTGYDDASTILPHRAAGYTWDGTTYHNAEFIDMSNPAGAGGLYSTVWDMYRWDRALYTDGILGADTRRAYFTPTADMGQGAGYAYGWAVAEMSGGKYILHSGGINGFSTFALRDPAEGLYVVVLSNVESAPTQAIALGLAAIALGDPYELPGQHTVVEVDPAVYRKYLGGYQVTPDVVLTVSTDGGHLYAQPTGRPAFEIMPESETDYFAKVNGVEVRMRFELTPGGDATGVTILQNGQELLAQRIE